MADLLNAYRPGAPEPNELYMVRPEVRILIGTETLWGALDNSSTAYTSYGVPVGLQTGKSFELGALASINPNMALNWEPVDTANLPQGRLYDLTSEDYTLSVEIMELKPDLIELLLHTSAIQESNQFLFANGGGCNLVTRPISIEWTNQACSAPTSEDATQGITGGIITLFDAMCTSGLDWSNMALNETNTITLEFTARPVQALAAGKRTVSMWLY